MIENRSQKSIFLFWLPLAATWIMMSVEGPFLAAVIARLPEPRFNLAAYGVAFAFALLIEAPKTQIGRLKRRREFVVVSNVAFVTNVAVVAIVAVVPNVAVVAVIAVVPNVAIVATIIAANNIAIVRLANMD